MNFVSRHRLSRVIKVETGVPVATSKQGYKHPKVTLVSLNPVHLLLLYVNKKTVKTGVLLFRFPDTETEVRHPVQEFAASV